MNDATIAAIFSALAAGIVCQAQEKAEAEVPSDKEAGRHAPVTTALSMQTPNHKHATCWCG